MSKQLLLLFAILVALGYHLGESKALSDGGIRSDVIETRFEGEDDDFVNGPKQPGWMKRQLLRFGNIASHVGGRLSGSALKVATIIEKLCKMLKTVIPIVAAVCNVGQFQFCSSADAPLELAAAIKPNVLDMNVPD